jgi:putative DNA primase/helicase
VLRGRERGTAGAKGASVSERTLQRIYQRTDLGNAERLVALYGDDLRYCHSFRKWLCWDGQRWRQDDSGGAGRAAKLTVRAIYGEAQLVIGDDGDGQAERKAIASWATKSESDARIRAMLARAADEADVVVFPSELDAYPWLLNVENGTVDLRTGKLNKHDPDDLITKLAGCEYDPKAESPTWQKFLERVLDNDAEMMGFLQRAVGYSLTGLTGEQCIFIPYGTGANGKSVFLGTLHKLLGAYAQQLPRETLMAGSKGGIPNDLAGLAGSRFATAIETRQRQRLDEELVKQLTGGDKIRARFLYGEFFEFVPVAKIWLATNHQPKIAGTDDGIWRRIRLIPFTVTIPRGEQNPQLPQQLEDELPGILRWAVDGCLAWQQQGLEPPENVIEATSTYRRSQDVLEEFLEQCCVLDPSWYAQPKELHDAYVQFSGERISQVELGKLLRERGFDSGKVKHKRVWFGVGLAGTGTDGDA